MEGIVFCPKHLAKRVGDQLLHARGVLQTGAFAAVASTALAGTAGPARLRHAALEFAVAPVEVDGAHVEVHGQGGDVDDGEDLGILSDDAHVVHARFDRLRHEANQRGLEGIRASSSVSLAHDVFFLHLVLWEASTHLQSANFTAFEGLDNQIRQQVHFVEEVLAEGAEADTLLCTLKVRVPTNDGRSNFEARITHALIVALLAAQTPKAGVAAADPDHVLVAGRVGCARDLFGVRAQLLGLLPHFVVEVVTFVEVRFLVRGFGLFDVDVVPKGVVSLSKPGGGVGRPVVLFLGFFWHGRHRLTGGLPLRLTLWGPWPSSSIARRGFPVRAVQQPEARGCEHQAGDQGERDHRRGEGTEACEQPHRRGRDDRETGDVGGC